MKALVEALRVMDPHTFELLVFHLLKARHPNIEIKHIDGSAGDEGLDVISGSLDSHPTVWQCKCFANGIRDSQKAKIKNSLNLAIQRVSPRRWILCLNVDMDSKTRAWFQRMAKS